MYKYTVAAVERLGPTSVLLKLSPTGESRAMSFLPGQYVTVRFAKDVRWSPARCFSIVSSPDQSDRLELGMRVSGRFTHAVERLPVGDAVEIQGPFGEFGLDAASKRPAVMLAGGIGITPFMSIIRYAAHLRSLRPITLVYSCRDQTEVPFGKELVELADKYRQLKLVIAVEQGPVDKLQAMGAVTMPGRITNEMLGQIVEAPLRGQDWLVCGPPRFMTGMVQMLAGAGVAEDQIMTEAFSQKIRHRTQVVRSWPYNVYALTGVGITAGFLAVMAYDMLRTLPQTGTYTTGGEGSAQPITSSTLDQAVNQIPATAIATPAPQVAAATPVPGVPVYTPAPTAAPTYTAPVSRVS